MISKYKENDTGDAQNHKNIKSCLGFIKLPKLLRGPGEGGGLHENFTEIDFLVVSYRRDQYLSDVFGPMKNFFS